MTNSYSNEEGKLNRLRDIVDITIKMLVPLMFAFMGWISYQIVETDRTQEVVLSTLININADILQVQMELKRIEDKSADRWTGDMQNVWGDSIIDRIEKMEEDHQYFLWNRR